MKTIVGKYRNDRLTLEELREARRLANEDGGAIEEMLYNEWMGMDFDAAAGDEAVSRFVYGEVLNRIVPVRRSMGWRVWRAVKVAAVVLLPVFMFFSVYLYLGQERFAPAYCSVFTRSNEKARVVLPDNSVVFLNGGASLSYDATPFGRKHNPERSVNFAGEGYFDIAKKEGLPFAINAGGTVITVHGTKFNLCTSKHGEACELALLEGKVSVNPKWDNREIALVAGEKIVIDNAARSYAIDQIGENDNSIAWKDGRLQFNYAPLPEVIAQLERAFGCRIPLPASHAAEHFTGTIPLRDRAAALRIVEVALDCTLTPR